MGCIIELNSQLSYFCIFCILMMYNSINMEIALCIELLTLVNTELSERKNSKWLSLDCGAGTGEVALGWIFSLRIF